MNRHDMLIFLDEYETSHTYDQFTDLFKDYNLNIKVLKYILLDELIDKTYIKDFFHRLNKYNKVNVDDLYDIVELIIEEYKNDDYRERIKILITNDNMLDLLSYYMKHNMRDYILDMIHYIIDFSSKFNIDKFEELLTEIANSKYYEYIQSSITKDYINAYMPLKSTFIEVLVDYLGYSRFPSGRLYETIKEYPFKLLPFDAEVLGNTDDDVTLYRENHGVVKSIYTDIYIPVIRYEGKSGRFYFDDDDEDDVVMSYCGYFYYFEPHSLYVLKSSKTLIAPNKLIALWYLNNMFIKYSKERFINEFVSKIPKRVRDYYIQMLNDPLSFDYSIYNAKTYAAEDGLDQYLCNIASSKGYEAIVLTSMTGGNRIVTEVYDTREREDSESNIYTF